MAATEEDDRSWLQALFTLQAAVLEGSRSLTVGSPDDLAASLRQHLPQSIFLSQFARLGFYGFYDLLQVQLSFFESVVRSAPLTLYCPSGASPAYAFSRRVFERHLLPLAQVHEDRSGVSSPDASSPSSVELSVTNVIGAEEELAMACREILALVEIHGYRFDDTEVVARSVDYYRSKLQLVFDRHLVPFTCTVGRPLAREPLVKALLRLASRPVNDFEQSALLDVVASPFYRGRINNIPVVERRPDVWRIAVASLGITKGNEDWSRLRASVTPLIRGSRHAGG